jgi:hypothetical protein
LGCVRIRRHRELPKSASAAGRVFRMHVPSVRK